MPRAVALSPHLDDAAFSCGGILARLAAAGWDVTVCTAFTRSVSNPTGFALACQLDKGLPAEVDYMALRRAEDAEACRRLGARPLWLDFAEAPHRGYGDARALFRPVDAGDDVALPLRRAVERVLSCTPELVLGPQAVGGHVDHVQLVHALRAALPEDAPVLWWTDFPYSMRPHSHPVRPFEADMARLPEHSIAGDTAARLFACEAYTTQIGFQFGGLQGLRNAMAEAGSEERVRDGRHGLAIPDCLLTAQPADSGRSG